MNRKTSFTNYGASPMPFQFIMVTWQLGTILGKSNAEIWTNCPFTDLTTFQETLPTWPQCLFGILPKVNMLRSIWTVYSLRAISFILCKYWIELLVRNQKYKYFLKSFLLTVNGKVVSYQTKLTEVLRGCIVIIWIICSSLLFWAYFA